MWGMVPVLRSFQYIDVRERALATPCGHSAHQRSKVRLRFEKRHLDCYHADRLVFVNGRERLSALVLMPEKFERHISEVS